jgi:hypothetical protein
VLGGALIIPVGLLNRPQDELTKLFAKRKKAVEMAGMQAVMEKERELGFKPKDVSSEDLGWDVESQMGDGKLRFIEVKGRVEGQDTITVTKNEILTALNKPDEFYLAVVEVVFEGEKATGKEPHYIQKPFQREPDFAATSVNYKWRELLNR